MENENCNNFSSFNSSTFFKESNIKFPKTLIDFKSSQNTLDNKSKIKNTLKYSNQFLRNEDWEYVSTTIENNTNITGIDLIGISINEYGLQKLGEIILNNKLISTLRLNWNYLCEYPNEFEYFCNCVGRSNLIHLNLSNNRINPSLVKSISQAILTSNYLNSIDLSWNEINDEGATKLKESLSRNNTIYEIVLTGNKINQGILDEIAGYLVRNRSFSISRYNLNEEFKISNTLSNRNSSTIFKPNYNEINQIRQENISIKFLEKEKEICEEFRARYDVQLIISSKLEKRIKELETLITIERNKVWEIREECEKEKEKEKALRLNYEEQIKSLKENLMKTSVELDSAVNTSEIKYSKYEREISILEKKNKDLSESLKRSNEIHEDKLDMIREEYEDNYTRLQATLESTRVENQKIKKEYQDQIKKNFSDFNTKLKELEETNRNAKIQKDELEKSNNELKKRMLDMQIEYEIKTEEKEKNYVDGEKIKNEVFIKSLEKRIERLEISKEEILNKNQELIREISNFKKSSLEENKEKDILINTIKIEKNNLIKSNTILQSELNKANLELKTNEVIIKKQKLQISEMKKEIDLASSNFEEKLKTQEDFYSNEKQKLEILKSTYETKIDELVKHVETLKSKLAKIEIDNLKYSEILKTEISKLIDENL